MKTKLFFVLVCLSLCSSLLIAGGSIYSRFGFGDLTYYGSSRMFAMGNTGIALFGDGFINRLNPAGLAGISDTRISGAYEYMNLSSKDNFGAGSYARGEFQGLAFAIPIARDRGATLMLETTPYSTVHYSIDREDNQFGNVSHQRFYGSGGLTSLGIGGSYALSQYTTVGAKYNYVFGGITQVDKIDFDDPTYTDSELQRHRYHSGSGFTAGLNFHGFEQLFNAPSLKTLTAGLVFSSPVGLAVQEESFHVIGSLPDTIHIGSNSARIPAAWGVGLEYHTAERYLIAADFYTQAWSSGDFSEKPTVDITSSTRIGLGLEILPLRTADTYVSRFVYRLGLGYNSSYIRIGSQHIDEYLVSGGVGIPIGPNSRMNIGLQLGIRGTTDNGLQRDTIFRLSVSLSASEAWFIRYEED
jgi:hypothetical protein